MDSGKIARAGFTLIELIVVIALIGAVTAIVVPQLGGRKSQEERKQFIVQLNALLRFSWQRAVASGNVGKVTFDFEKQRVTLSEGTGKKDDKGKPITQPIVRVYQNTKLTIPSQLVVKNFYIEGFDEAAGRELTTAYFLITPEGIAQSVVINFVDTKDKRAGRGRPVGLVLNPFSAQFVTYGTFKKP